MQEKESSTQVGGAGGGDLLLQECSQEVNPEAKVLSSPQVTEITLYGCNINVHQVCLGGRAIINTIIVPAIVAFLPHIVPITLCSTQVQVKLLKET